MKSAFYAFLIPVILCVGMGPVQTATAAVALGPLRVDPVNPRYFTDGSGKAVYLTGAHTWGNLQDTGENDSPAPFDFDAYLEFLGKYPHNFFRLWRYEATRVTDDDGKRTLFCSPHPWLRTGATMALDGKPRFDLTRFDEAYFARLRERVSAAGQRGIYVSIMLFEGWGLRFASDTWRNHPFNGANNINGIHADVNNDGKGLEYSTLAVPAVTRLQEAYVRKVIDTVNDLDNVLYEISNENHPDSFLWQVLLATYVRAYELTKPKQHPVGLTSDGFGGYDDTDRLLASTADWISPSPDKYDYRSNPPAANGQKVIITDTDHLWGLGGDRAWVWKSFLRGLNPILMDPYNGSVVPDSDGARWESIRKAMGGTLRLAQRLDLRAMTPQPALASTGYCLASSGEEFLVYLPAATSSGSSLWLDLRHAPGTFAVEWIDPADGETITHGTVMGGETLNFSAPGSGDAVLYLRRTSLITAHPQNQTVAVGAKASLTVATAITPAPVWEWWHNGAEIVGAAGATLTLNDVQPTTTGLYAAQATSGTTTTASNAAIVGVTTNRKLIGAGKEVLSNVFVAANGNTFDQILLTGAAAAVTSDFSLGQITRVSYVDLDDDITQVEFSGPGTLSLVLNSATGPARAVNYNQAIDYMKGHAGIVITGANEHSNLSVFSVGRANSVDQTLFKSTVAYDGIADIAFIAIATTNGKFGGLRTANANYFASRGLTGVYAPGVAFVGPVFIGDVSAFDTATPAILLGSAADVRITGGDLLQANSRAVQVSGITRLNFTAGGDSHAHPQPARGNRAKLEQNGQDVTPLLVPAP